jgi:hypothetical protein
LFVLTSYSAKAQYSFGVSLNYAIASDDLAKAANNGYGATFHTVYTFDEYLSAGLNVGYVTFTNKNSDSKVSPLINGNNLQIIPVTVNAKVYFGSINEKPGAKSAAENTVRPFFGVDLGWATANLQLLTGSKNYVVIAPQLGTDFKVSDNFKVCLNVIDNVMAYNRLNGGSDIISWYAVSLGGMYKF